MQLPHPVRRQQGDPLLEGELRLPTFGRNFNDSERRIGLGDSSGSTPSNLRLLIGVVGLDCIVVCKQQHLEEGQEELYNYIRESRARLAQLSIFYGLNKETNHQPEVWVGSF